ncbi:transcription factor with AP2 domain(s), putative [Plasmodium chabaudi adami]|uniref:Transcription factor with AP2 domain(S), putative n=1 Tax=Plasmodium chabaudi adami TaxID=5826 RepID=A0A1C6XVL2_PLACE|nr:transcription factor with AP2 domain(s), putative [Plasmodium chabaudi adami]
MDEHISSEHNSSNNSNNSSDNDSPLVPQQDTINFNSINNNAINIEFIKNNITESSIASNVALNINDININTTNEMSEDSKNNINYTIPNEIMNTIPSTNGGVTHDSVSSGANNGLDKMSDDARNGSENNENRNENSNENSNDNSESNENNDNSENRENDSGSGNNDAQIAEMSGEQKEVAPLPSQVVSIKKKVGRPKGATSANKVVKKEEKVSTSSSGYPGVSWNKRMCAWLAFFYDGASRRSRTFHPKHFNMDKDQARLAAVEFMKSLENNGRKKSTKIKGGKNKIKQMGNEDHINNIMHNGGPGLDHTNNLISLNNNMHMMAMNPAFYMHNSNRNFNITNPIHNDRNHLNNLYNNTPRHHSLNNNNMNHINNLSKVIRDSNGIYMHNNHSNNNNPNSIYNNNIHMSNNPNPNNNSHTASNDHNNINYLNELMYHSNLLQGGGGGPSASHPVMGSGGIGLGHDLNFFDRNMNNGNINDVLNLEENLGLQNKDIERLMNTLFRKNYNNMNMNMPNMDDHFFHSNNGNTNNNNINSNGTGTINDSNNTISIINNNGAGALHGVDPANSVHNNHRKRGGNNNDNNPNNNNSLNSINNTSSQNAHMYLSNNNGDIYDTNNLNNSNNIHNYYDYNYDIYRGETGNANNNISPHIIEMMHRMNNDLKEGKNMDHNITDDFHDINYMMQENGGWLNQIRHNNIINNNSRDLCDPNISPEHVNNNIKKQIELNKGKKATKESTFRSILNIGNRTTEMAEPVDETANNNNMNDSEKSSRFDMNGISCNCSPHIRNQKNHYCMYYKHNLSQYINDNSANYNYMSWGPNNNNVVNTIDKGEVESTGDISNSGVSNNSGSRVGIVTDPNNNNNNAFHHNNSAKHLAQNFEINQKENIRRSQYDNNNYSNIPTMPKYLHYQQNMNNHDTSNGNNNEMQHIIKQNNNYIPKTINSNFNNKPNQKENRNSLISSAPHGMNNISSQF